MVEQLRVLEVVGGCVGCVYALLGVYALLNQLGDQSIPSMMQLLAQSLFLIFFGAAAACVCFFKGPEPLNINFGFLTTWIGRGVFFLVMGLFMFPTVCPAGKKWCLEDGTMSALGSIAAFASMIVGIVVLVLRCTVMRQSSGDSWTFAEITRLERRVWDKVDIAAAIASGGMALLGVKMFLNFLDAFADLTVRELFLFASLMLIILFFGIASLVASTTNNAFVIAFFGFLAKGWPRGLFYVLMGFWTFAFVYKDSMLVFDWICLACSIVSIAVGVVIVAVFCACARSSGLLSG